MAADDREALTKRVHTAHGDAWQAQGILRTPYGGAVGQLPGIRLMTSGLPHPQWNGGDVFDPSVVDVDRVRQWFAARDAPWGVRVPPGLDWTHGRHLFTQRQMGLVPTDYRAPAAVPGLEVRLAQSADLDTVVAIDAECFHSDPATSASWLAPLVESPAAEVGLGLLDGDPVATLYLLSTAGEAGRCAYVAGVGVLAAARRRGVASAMTAHLLERSFAAGAHLAHLHPDDDAAAAVYAGLGFVEVAGLDIYLDC